MALSLLAAAALSEYSPAFLWSPTASATDAAGGEHLAAVSGVDVERIASLLKGSSGAAPEVRLVFQAEGLSTEVVRQHGSRLPALDRLLTTSATSLTMPFTTAHDSQLFRSAPRVPASEALTYFQTNVQIFANGKADTIIVELPGVASASTLPQHDAHVEAVTRAVHEGCRGNYAAVLTAKRGMSGETHGSARRLSAAYATRPYLHTGPTLLTAQLVSLILLIIFLSGFCCLFSLQTPKKFEENKGEAAH